METIFTLFATSADYLFMVFLIGVLKYSKLEFKNEMLSVEFINRTKIRKFKMR